MRMNRRNVLVGLGTIVAGGGAALGTGAFSSVEANRSVTVDIAGDNNALLAIEADNSYEGSEGNQVTRTTIDLSSSNLAADGLNTEATTTFNSLLAITNQSGEEVQLKDSTDGTSLSSASFNIDDNSDITLNFEVAGSNTVNDNSGNFDGPASDTIDGSGSISGDDTLSPGDTVFYNLEFVIGDPTDSTNFNSNITIAAE